MTQDERARMRKLLDMIEDNEKTIRNYELTISSREDISQAELDDMEAAIQMLHRWVLEDGQELDLLEDKLADEVSEGMVDLGLGGFLNHPKEVPSS